MAKQPQPPHMSLETFRALCNAAAEFCSLAPWKFLADSNMFGIQDGQSGPIRLASVMGNAGQVFGLFVHRGEQGLRWAMTVIFRPDEPESADQNFKQSQEGLTVEFVQRGELAKHDIAMLKQIDFKPLQRTARKWLQFRSYRPGTAPWFLEGAEAELLLADLQKTTAFARLAAETRDLFDGRASNEFPIYSKKAIPDCLKMDDLTWQKLVLAPEPLPTPVSTSDAELAQLVMLPQDDGISLELNCLYSPGLVTEGERPYFPWLALAVDARSGGVYGTALDDSQTKGLEKVAARCLLQAIAKLKRRPGEILVSRSNLVFALEAITRALHIRVLHISSLFYFEQAYRHLRRNMEHHPQT